MKQFVIRVPSVAKSNLITEALPALGRASPVSIRIVVVLPALFDPRKLNTSFAHGKINSVYRAQGWLGWVNLGQLRNLNDVHFPPFD